MTRFRVHVEVNTPTGYSVDGGRSVYDVDAEHPDQARNSARNHFKRMYGVDAVVFVVKTKRLLKVGA